MDTKDLARLKELTEGEERHDKTCRSDHRVCDKRVLYISFFTHMV